MSALRGPASNFRPPTIASRAIVGGVLLAAMALCSQARADRRIYSYDSATPITRKMTENGLTFVFEKSLISTRVLSMIETHDVGAADLRPVNTGVVGRGGLRPILGPDAPEHDVYEITPAKDGKALSHALCRGADHVWLVFGSIKLDRDLRVHALGHDPDSGKTRLCVTLDYNFHGAWALPQAELRQPSRVDPFNDAPANRRF